MRTGVGAVGAGRGMLYGRRDRIVIVGAGPAGWAAAEELRRLEFTGAITVLCDESVAPYDRTACSKGLLAGRQKPRDVRLSTRECTDVDWQLGRRAEWLDLPGRTVTVDTGERYEFDGLVIATGAGPVLPDGWPAGEPGLHLLHSLDDAWAIRRELRDARRVAVVGGGLTGSEVACTVRSLAREAVVVNSQPALMNRVLGEPVGQMVTREHAEHGVELRLGHRVSSVDRGRGRWRLRLDDGSDVAADVVVVAAGERPDVEWLSGTGIDTSDGVLCDENLRVVGTEGIVAAGVLARWPNLRYSAEPRRVGHWIAALEQGRAAARGLLLGERAGGPFTLLPRFWSQQLGIRLQVCGVLPRDGEVAITEMRPGRSDPARAGVLATYYQDGEIAGVVAANAPQAFTVASRTLEHTQGMVRSDGFARVTPLHRTRAAAV